MSLRIAINGFGRIGRNAFKIALEKVNVDENNERASAAGVLSIPTYVIEKDGKEVVRLIGARSKEAFKQWLLSHL